MIIALLISYPAGADVAEMESLLAQGKHEDAFLYGQAMEAEYAGTVQFDFLMGLAALRSGHYANAVFAFERVLIMKPDYHRARLELARVYFLQKDYVNSRSEFKTVLSQNPPVNVRHRIQDYLLQIDRRLKAMRSTRSARISIAAGHDSNINSATSEQSVAGPLGFVIQLTEDSREIGDQFTETGIGGDVEYRLSGQSYVAAGMSVIARNNIRDDRFDTTSGGVELKYRVKQASHQWNFPFQYQQFNVSGNPFRRLMQSGVEYTHARKNRLISLHAQLGQLRYPENQSRNANVFNGGINWRQRVAGNRQLLSCGVYVGYENPHENIGEHHGRRYLGSRLDWQYALTKKLLLSVTGVYQNVEHLARDIVFTDTRKDQFSQLTFGGTWYFNRRFAVNLITQSLFNNSNIPIYEYDRSLVRGGVSYVF